MSVVKRLLKGLELLGFFLWELTRANFRVARDVLRPRPHIHPAIVAVPVDLRSDLALTILASLITLTPGTISLDLSADRKLLFVHAMYFDDDDKAAFIRGIKRGFERRVAEVFEP